MVRRYDRYLYIDLTALRRDAVEGDDEPAGDEASISCAGRTLLVLTGRGIEVVRVPSILN